MSHLIEVAKKLNIDLNDQKIIALITASDKDYQKSIEEKLERVRAVCTDGKIGRKAKNTLIGAFKDDYNSKWAI